MNKQKIGIIPIILYVLAALFLVATIITFQAVNAQMEQYILYQGLVVSENLAAVINMYAGAVAPTLFYTIGCAALGYIIQLLGRRGVEETTALVAVVDDAADEVAAADDVTGEEVEAVVEDINTVIDLGEASDEAGEVAEPEALSERAQEVVEKAQDETEKVDLADTLEPVEKLDVVETIDVTTEAVETPDAGTEEKTEA